MKKVIPIITKVFLWITMTMTWPRHVTLQIKTLSHVEHLYNTKHFHCQCIIGSCATIFKQSLCAHFALCEKVIALMKDKGANLNTLITSLTRIVFFVPLVLPQVQHNHMLPIISKCCEYASNDLKVCSMESRRCQSRMHEHPCKKLLMNEKKWKQL